MKTLAAAILLALTVATLASDGLARAQGRFVALLGFLLAATERCGFVADTVLVDRLGEKVGVTMEGANEMGAMRRAYDDAISRFSGLRGPVECAYALERYGSAGSELPGLLHRP